MSGPKLTFIVFIIIILSLGGLLGFYFYLNRSTPLQQAPVANTKPTFSGFDQVTLDNSGSQKNTVDLGGYTDQTSTTTSTSSAPIEEKKRLLRLISAAPVAGADFIVRNVDISTSSILTATSTRLKNKKIIPIEFIRFILKANGNVFETGTSSTSTYSRITNYTIPKLEEAFFNNSGDSVIIRNIIRDDGIQTRLLSMKQNSDPATSTIAETSIVNLPYAIDQLSLSPDKTKIFYFRKGINQGSISNFDGGGVLSLFDSPFTEWLPNWISTGTILLTTKPSFFANGYLYSLDVKTGDIKKLLGDIVGLTTLGSKDGKNVLYAKTDNGSVDLSVHNIKDGSGRSLFVQTLPEKCVWGNKYTNIIYCAIPKQFPKSNSYPDDWYLGLMHFNDSVWRLNLETGENKFIVSPETDISRQLDIVNMTMSKNDDYLMFTDKSTYSLWGIKLESPIPPVIKTATSTKAVKK